MMEWAWKYIFVPQKSEHIDVFLGFAQLHAEENHELPEWPSSSPKEDSDNITMLRLLLSKPSGMQSLGWNCFAPPPSTTIIQFMRQTQVRIQSWSVAKSGRKLERLEDLESSQQLLGAGSIRQHDSSQDQARSRFPPYHCHKTNRGPKHQNYTQSKGWKKQKHCRKKQYRMQDAVLFSDHFFNMKEHHLRLNMLCMLDGKAIASKITGLMGVSSNLILNHHVLWRITRFFRVNQNISGQKNIQDLHIFIIFHRSGHCWEIVTWSYPSKVPVNLKSNKNSGK